MGPAWAAGQELVLQWECALYREAAASNMGYEAMISGVGTKIHKTGCRVQGLADRAGPSREHT